MIFFDINVRLDIREKSKNDGRTDIRVDCGGAAEKKKWASILSGMNDSLGFECGLDKSISVIAYNGKNKEISFLAMCSLEKKPLQKCIEYIAAFLKENYRVDDVKVTGIREVCLKELLDILNLAYEKDYCEYGNRSAVRLLGTGCLDDYEFKMSEKIYEGGPRNKSDSVGAAKRIMADKTLLDELDRIYSEDNMKEFMGHPVHYVIKSGDIGAARDIIDVLVPSLFANKRLLGSRSSYIYDISESCYQNDNLASVFKNSQGAVVVIDMTGNNENHGNYASAYEDVIINMQDIIRDYASNTLCIFVEQTSRPGFSDSMISHIQDDIDIIEIREGCGDLNAAKRYMNFLVDNSKYVELNRNQLYNALPKKEKFTVSDVYTAYKKWVRSGLRNEVYRAYEKSKVYAVKGKRNEGDAYKRLQNMIGLSEVKGVVDQIISAYKIRNLRMAADIETEKNAMHMVFTGNPGSAKTTVARLLGEILKTEGIIESPNVVECGRAELVGKYVGWTAREVQAKFREAMGGILFIDEAYSLVDDSNSFGAEAINTIVQEMENYRDEVIVIFAGYPEKMETFLDANEGLRSRIAFHLNFPDYTAKELMDIMKLLAKEKEYRLAPDVADYCDRIFADACANKDFGNGRFARNLLEQATLKQAERLCKSSRKPGKTALKTLKASDFDVNVAKLYKKEYRTAIGF